MGQARVTEGFKADAIKQITERGHSIADVSQRLGVSTHSLYAWIKRHTYAPNAAAMKIPMASCTGIFQKTLTSQLTTKTHLIRWPSVSIPPAKNTWLSNTR